MATQTPSRMQVNISRNLFAYIFLLISLILASVLYYRGTQLDTAQGRIEQMQRELGRLQDENVRQVQALGATQKQLAECRQQGQLQKVLPNFGK